jgi:hypothetical protein
MRGKNKQVVFQKQGFIYLLIAYLLGEAINEQI